MIENLHRAFILTEKYEEKKGKNIKRVLSCKQVTMVFICILYFFIKTCYNIQKV